MGANLHKSVFSLQSDQDKLLVNVKQISVSSRTKIQDLPITNYITIPHSRTESDNYIEKDDLIQLRYDQFADHLQVSGGDAEVITRRRSPRFSDRSVEFGDFVFKDDLQTHRPRFVRVSPNANCRGLVELIVTEMHALPPNLVLSVLTRPNDPKIFRLVHHTEQFIVGMEKVIESTSLWIMTHGQDCGISRVIGESTERYLERFDYQNRWCEVLRKQINRFRNILLIGFVNEDDILSNGARYTRVSKRLRLEINRKSFQDPRLLNWNHSLFVVVRNDTKHSSDCCANPVDAFRCRLEHYLFSHTVPRLQLIDRHRAIQPRKLDIISLKTYESHAIIKIKWDNPYFNTYLNDIFENFEISVSFEGKEARRIATKPKGRSTTCELFIKSPMPPKIVFSVQSKTLYGRSDETKLLIDIRHIFSQANESVPVPSKLPMYMRRKDCIKSSSQSMDIECVPSSDQVTVSFVPFHPTTFHSIRIINSDGNLVASRALETCVTRCHFTGLHPDTEYTLSVSAYWIAPGQSEQCIGGPFIAVFQTKQQVIQNYDCEDNKDKPIATPLIYVIFGGGAETIKTVRHHLETKAAAMVLLAGTKGAADLIDVVITLFKTSPTPSEINGFVRRLLSRYVRTTIMSKNNPLDPDYHRQNSELVEDLLYIGTECSKTRRIRCSNVWCTRTNLEKISKEFVKAWIVVAKKVRISRVKHKPAALISFTDKDQYGFLCDTKLALDLNNCNVAKSEIFEDTSRYKSKVITPTLFELALLTKEREAFVDLFLEYGYKIHKYLTEEKLKYIFEYEDEVDPYDRDFFITTTVEGIMGLTGDEDKLPDDFISEQLPDVIRHLTGLHTNFIGANPRIIFMVKSEEDFPRPDRKPDSYSKMRNKAIVEREREALKMLTAYALLMNSYSSRFTDFAVKLLDLSFTENEQITHESLQCKYPDWNDRSPIEFAHGVANKEFMAHPSCQKWITRTYFGGITLRETTLEMWHVPDFVKILACSLLVLPMYVWINFSPIGKGDSMEPKSRCKLFITGSDRLYGDRRHGISMGELFRPKHKLSIWSRMRRFMDRWINTEKDVPLQSPTNEEDKNFGGQIERSKQQSRFSRRKAIFISRVAASPPFWKKLMLLWGAPVTKFTTDGFFYLLYLILFSIVTIWPTCGNLLLDLVFWIWTASITFENARLCYTKSKTINHLPLRLSVIDVLMQFSFLTAFGYMKFFELWEGWSSSSPCKMKSLMGTFLVYFFLRVFRQYYPIHPKLGPAMVKLTYMITDDFVSYLYIFAVFMLSVGVAATAIIHPHHPLNQDLVTRVLKRGVMALFRTDIRDLEGIDPTTCQINITRGSCSKLSSGLSFLYGNPETYYVHGISNPRCSVSTWIAWVMVLQYGYMSSVFLRSLLTAMFGITGRNVGAISEQIWMYDRYEIIMDYERKPRLPPPLSLISYVLSAFAYIYKQIRGLPSSNQYPGALKFESDSNSFQEFIGMLSEFTRGDTSEWGQPRWEDDKGNQYWKLKAEKVFEMTQSKDKNEQRLRLLNIKSDIIQRAATEEASTISIIRQLIAEIVTSESRYQHEEKSRLNGLSRFSPYIGTRINRTHVRDDQVPWDVEFGDQYNPIVVNIDVDSAFGSFCLRQSPAGSSIEIEHASSEEHSSEQKRNPVGRTGAKGKGCLLNLGANKFKILFVTRKTTIVQFYKLINVNDWTCLPFTSSSYVELCQVLSKSIVDSILSQRTQRRFDRSEMIEFMTRVIEQSDLESFGFKFGLVHNGYLDDYRNTDDAWIDAEVWHFHWDTSDFRLDCSLFSEEAGEFEWACLDPNNVCLITLKKAVERVITMTDQ
ncbi:hypothetical protein ACOME3_005590 [Neoechinorhynchus agilis]